MHEELARYGGLRRWRECVRACVSANLRSPLITPLKDGVEPVDQVAGVQHPASSSNHNRDASVSSKWRFIRRLVCTRDVPMVLGRQVDELARNASALQRSEGSHTLAVDDAVVLSTVDRQLRRLPLIRKRRRVPLLFSR